MSISNLETLHQKGLIKPPSFVIGGTQYQTIMGSFAYGVSSDTSDVDVYGFCMPPKGLVFPHLEGEIFGFGTQKQRFEQYQEHHIKEKDSNKEYDLNIYSVIKYFHLCMENNPNMVDSLFTEHNCVIKATKLGNIARDNRKLFLHKGCWHRFKGYAFAELKKVRNKKPLPESKRYELVQKFGFDVKHAYHIVRLMLEVEQILMEGDLDLMRHKEQLKAIRRGEWTLEQIEGFFNDKCKSLETVYSESKLPWGPREDEIKQVLLSILEEHYGSLDGCIAQPDEYRMLLLEIQQTMGKFKI